MTRTIAPTVLVMLLGCATESDNQTSSPSAAQIAYDSATSGSTTVQEALDDVAATLADHEKRLDALATRRNVIVCRFTSVSFSLPMNVAVIAHTFTAGECGGTLPDATYVGALGRLVTCSTSVDAILVASSGESDGPGVSFRRNGTSACNGPAELAAIYHKVN